MLSNSLPSHLDSDHTHRALLLSVNSKVYHIQRLFPQSSLLQNLLWCQTLSAEFSNLNRESFLYFSWTPPSTAWVKSCRLHLLPLVCSIIYPNAPLFLLPPSCQQQLYFLSFKSWFRSQWLFLLAFPKLPLSPMMQHPSIFIVCWWHPALSFQTHFFYHIIGSCRNRWFVFKKNCCVVNVSMRWLDTWPLPSCFLLQLLDR